MLSINLSVAVSASANRSSQRSLAILSLLLLSGPPFQHVVQPEFEDQRHTRARRMKKTKGFLSLPLVRHRYTITQNLLDNTRATWASCRHVPPNHSAAQQGWLGRGLLPARGAALGSGAAAADRAHHPQRRSG